jgi:hypothetical protein
MSWRAFFDQQRTRPSGFAKKLFRCGGGSAATRGMQLQQAA